ncbi:DUF4097 family beta strand repeat-containing protein [Lachnoclostridium phytofermentans]|uniref:Membrane protein-like protein n=1 Tax=Lachnoclostridium phytofermentans (strain ATCC 700394 / DSM 18823 / ISDg) TaxID=357809 RepID=A9KHP8_LACP7|nr:DUF4097 family beta strand repeat-containing protein [Lachnoclostridium phytofermentans]ABX42333.1 membrane protein-like protein [Lachnoclostridium phytofermentans ISDg]
MTKNEYMEKLKETLVGFEADITKEILEDYEEHFEMGLKKGKSAEQICEELGDINEIAKELKGLEKEHTSSKNNKEENTTTNSEWKQEKTEEVNLKDIIVDALFADVIVIPSGSNQITLNYVNYGDQNQQMMYEFRSWQEGDKIFAKVIKKETNFGFFNYIKTPRMKIEIKVPDYFPNIHLNSTSGDMKLTGSKSNEVVVSTISGDIELQNYHAKTMQLKSLSGDVKLVNSNGEMLRCNSTSGDLRLERVNYKDYILDTSSGEIELIRAEGISVNSKNKSGDISLRDCRINKVDSKTLSGDVTIENIMADSFHMQSTSGDVRAEDSKISQFSLRSTSGDVRASRIKSSIINATSKSGDVSATAESKEWRASTISGEVSITSECDAMIKVSTISGDVRLQLQNHGNGYEANIRTVSGTRSLTFEGSNSNLYRNGSYVFGNGGCKVEANTTSGDIKIRG